MKDLDVLINAALKGIVSNRKALIFFRVYAKLIWSEKQDPERIRIIDAASQSQKYRNNCVKCWMRLSHDISWQQEQWQQLMQRKDRLPHALLLLGIEVLARRILRNVLYARNCVNPALIRKPAIAIPAD